MAYDELCHQMLANAAEITRLQQAVHSTFRLRDRDAASHAAWHAATEEFKRRYDALAFPGGAAKALTRLEAREPQALEAAIVFVECRPYFFRSGYLRAKLLRRLKRVAPGTPYEARVLTIVGAERLRRANRNRPSERVG